MHPSLRNNDNYAKRIVMAVILLLAGAALALLGWQWWRRAHPRPLVSVVTVAGSGPQITAAGSPASGQLSDPFGVAVGRNGVIYLTDGASGTLFRLEGDAVRTIATGLTMPSAIAVASDTSVVVANTGSHTIVRIDSTNGSSAVIAGASGVAGDVDGLATESRFNAPIGLTVSRDGTIFVADTYNDRIRAIDRDGRVSTLAGGSQPGYRDANARDALFDTPCAIIEATDGALICADTGNHRLRRVERNGTVTTLAGAGDVAERDGNMAEAAFDQPMALAWRNDKTLFVADAGAGSLRVCSFGEQPGVSTLAGGTGDSFDVNALHARLGRPVGLAFATAEELVFADGAHGLLRAIVPAQTKLGHAAQPEKLLISPPQIRSAVPPRWPFDPPMTRREIAGTFGEVRGEVLPEHDAWFHNGLDVPGHYGEVVRAIFSERVALPFAVEGFGGTRERVRLPLIGYIHLRLGRDANDRPFGDKRFIFRRDEQGELAGVRIPRGALFKAGDALGTLNRLNHVHLIAGPYSGEVNALAALEFPGLVDTLPPVIEGVRLETAEGEPIDSSQPKSRDRSVSVSGRVRIIVRAYDRADGIAAYRKLGPYRLGYQVLKANGAAAPGFETTDATLNFDRLPADPPAVRLVYAYGSESGYEGKTIFDYIVTNTLRDGRASEGYWDTSRLPAGRYTLRVFVEDFVRNRTTRDVPVLVATAEH
jgi:sugar lactone lactonase YvrE